MSACPDKELLLHALADNELDAGNVLALEAHMAGCQACAAELAAIRQVKSTLADAKPHYAPPASLAAHRRAGGFVGEGGRVGGIAAKGGT